MKICIVSEIFKPQPEGGAEIFSRKIAENLASNHEVVVLSLGHTDDPNAPVGPIPLSKPYRHHRIPFRNSYLPSAVRPKKSKLTKVLWHARNFLGAVAAPELEEFLRSEKFDVIYAQNCSRMLPVLYHVAKKLGVPVCQHVHDYALACGRTSMYRNGRNCERQCTQCRLLTSRTRHAVSSIRQVISVSQFVYQRIRDQNIRLACEVDVMHNMITPRSELDQLLTVRPKADPVFTFGYLGALSEEKGLDVLFDAFSAIPDEVPAKLIVAGRGQTEYVEHLKVKARKLSAGRIEFLGFVPPQTVYMRAEVVVVPSLWHEPQSLILFEAANHGVPVLASDVGGNIEIMQGYGTGMLYQSLDAKGLSKLMTTFATEGAEVFRASIPERFPGLVNFDGSAEASRYYERLERILERTARATV